MPTQSPLYNEVIDILKHAKKHQPFKADSWCASEFIKVVWFAHSQGLLKNTSNGYELSQKGEMLLIDKKYNKQ